MLKNVQFSVKYILIDEAHQWISAPDRDKVSRSGSESRAKMTHKNKKS
jgi:hypothetical protein